MFEYEKKHSYRIENRNDMTRIHNSKIKNLDECDLLHDIINYPKRAKKLNIQYSPILNGCVNKRKGKANF